MSAAQFYAIGDDELTVSVSDHIATVTLNRPHRKNALSVAVSNGLAELWPKINASPDIRVVILTSADCGVFSAGMDLKEAAAVKANEGVDILKKLKDPFLRGMRSVSAPVIAAMTGSFTAGGMVLALNADLRVGLQGTEGGIAEAKVGRGSPWAVPLLWMLPQPLLMEMVLTGDFQPIERLHAVGFVNYVEETPDAVRARARQLAERIRDNAPLSVKAGKSSLLAGMDLGAAQGLKRAEELHRPAYESWDAQEGPRAFAEKRKPQWRGA